MRINTTPPADAAVHFASRDVHRGARRPGLFFARSSATRALTRRPTSADGSGAASGNRIVPVEVGYRFRSAVWRRLMAAVIGYRLVCCLHAAYQTRIRPSSLNAGML